MKDVKTSMWLDFLNYIFIPSTIGICSLELLKVFETKKFLDIIIFIIAIITAIIEFIFLQKRKEKILYIHIPFLLATLIGYVSVIINRLNITKTNYIIELILVGIVIWFIPNIIYIIKRKDSFRKHNVAHIKKCPGCKRIIPIKMKSCGKCNYKED